MEATRKISKTIIAVMCGMLANLTIMFLYLETPYKIVIGIPLTIVYYAILSRIFKPMSFRRSLKCMRMLESAQGT
jgi:hypothetical protein